MVGKEGVNMRIRCALDLLTPPVVAQACRKLMRSARGPRVARQLEGHDRLHLACGTSVLNGWANIDLKSNGAVVGWDLTDRLPVRAGAIDLVFCEHFIEHLTMKQATALLVDCHRVLRPNGTLRLSTPSLKKVVTEYASGGTQEWRDVGWNPATPCQMVNEAFRLWGHRFVYDEEELRRILDDAGYREVTQVAWHESTTPALRGLECRPFHGEIILEATK